MIRPEHPPFPHKIQADLLSTESWVGVLLSMTGFGEARIVDDRWSVVVEVRTVNNRHLKLQARLSDPYGGLEPDFEKLIRETVRRGTVTLSVRVDRPRSAADYRLNMVALQSYHKQLNDLALPEGRITEFSALLALPGVVEERKPTSTDDPYRDWLSLAAVTSEALSKLQTARADEGRAMAGELLTLADQISERLGAVEVRGPEIVAAYQKRIVERVRTLVAGQGVSIEPEHLIREVAIFAERADIAEEIVRLRAHLAQYAEVIAEPESAGRKLEFVVQEIGREVNTIGSKANDVAVSRSVVEIKGLLEKIRELIQNVE